MFIAVLFTIGKTWKQPKCPSTDEWIKKMWYMYTMEYYSAIKKNEIMPSAATWRDLEIIILSEISQTQKDKYHMISLACGVLKNMIQMNLQNRNRPTNLEKELMFTRGRVGGIDWEFGIDICTLLYLKYITSKDLLYSTGNAAQYSVIT